MTMHLSADRIPTEAVSLARMAQDIPAATRVVKALVTDLEERADVLDALGLNRSPADALVDEILATPAPVETASDDVPWCLVCDDRGCAS